MISKWSQLHLLEVNDLLGFFLFCVAHTHTQKLTEEQKKDLMLFIFIVHKFIR